MNVLIFGSNGQVGFSLKEYLSNQIIPIYRKDCNLMNLDKIKETIDLYKPDLVINAAAYTKVDKAEIEKDIAFRVNSDAPKVMAKKAQELKIPFVHFSTDYVFNGKMKRAYTEKDSPSPLGVYGASKLAGEQEIQKIGGSFFIFRTSWVYSKIGQNFYLTINRLAKEKDQLDVVIDQVGVPTSSIFISKQIQKIITKLPKTNSGIFHLVPNGYCSWYEFSKAIIEKMDHKFKIPKIVPIKSKDFSTLAIRPQNSVLDNSLFKSTFMLEFNDWQSELKNL